MNKLESEKRLQTIVYQYEVNQLEIPEIAKIFGVSRQAIHGQLKRAGIRFRYRQRYRRFIDREILLRKYVNDNLPISKLEKVLKTNAKVIVRELQRHSIERRPKNYERRKPSELDHLPVGGSVLIACPDGKPLYSILYDKASVRKIKISVRSVDPDHVRVTRIA